MALIVCMALNVCMARMFEPQRKKTSLLDFRTGLTQRGLCSFRGWIEHGNLGFRKKRNHTMSVGKTKALISFAVTAKLICTFVFT